MNNEYYRALALTTHGREIARQRQLGKTEMNRPRCPYCDDTGDVHGFDGEWRGRCTCAAGRALKPWTPTDVRLSTPPCDHSERIDVKFRDGLIVRNCLPNTWAWGEADNVTITYWRKSK